MPRVDAGTRRFWRRVDGDLSRCRAGGLRTRQSPCALSKVGRCCQRQPRQRFIMLTWSLSSCNTITLKHPGAQRKRSQQPKMRKTRRQSRASSWLLLCSVRLEACSSGTSHVLYITRHVVFLHVTAYALPAASSPPSIHGSREAVLRHHDRNTGRCESRAGALLLSLPHCTLTLSLLINCPFTSGMILG